MLRSIRCYGICRKWPGMIIPLVLLFVHCSGDTSDSTEYHEHSREIAFISERIDMTVDPGLLTLTGHYTFRRSYSTPQRFAVSYPFPVNHDMSFPDSIDICRVIDKQYIAVNKQHDYDNVSFIVPFDEADTVTVKVQYTQRLSSNIAQYILTTTAAWGVPLEHAEFFVSVPDSLDHVALSYTPDLTKFENGRIIYCIKRTRFMPEKDLVVRW